MTSAITFLKYALSIGALEFVPEGRRLNNNRISPYFLDYNLFNTGVKVSYLAKAYSDIIIKKGVPDVIFGATDKGSSTAAAIAMTIGGDVGFAYNRKRPKHPGGKTIIGAPLVGKTAAIIDEAMTTGSTAGRAFNSIYNQGGNPQYCVMAFDRKERSTEGNLSTVQDFKLKYRIPVFSIATLDDLIILLKENKDPVFLSRVMEYKANFCV